ncbi:LytTR family transcriptional regulator DNA-binding domain-containing protein [Desulfamplus magnetovallimortis]|uniref:LytTR family transcriptional regulator DNA-binding domain-containing protein n=1 Tax=Desulfamplus magnetovallimortis TaxID=1246637 RepID=UPI0009BC1284
MKKNLSYWQDSLPAPPFIQLDRSTILNLNHVASWQAIDNRKLLIHLKEFNEPVKLGRTASERFKLIIKNQ